MKPAWNRKITLIVLALLFIASGVVSYVMWAEHAYENGWSLGRAYPQGPVQPIAFSHRLHAGVRGISCQYCHQWVRTADSAGIPPLSTCMNCHNVIKGTNPFERKEIAKLAGYAARHQEIKWVRVYDLPDHVHFPHKVHLWALQKNGTPQTRLVCAECHGKVWTMDRVYMAKDLIRMGTCLECHAHPPSPAMRQGPNDCWECHK